MKTEPTITKAVLLAEIVRRVTWGLDWRAAVVFVILVLALRLFAQDPPRPPAAPALEPGVTTQRTALAAPKAGRSVLVEVDLVPGYAATVGCLVFWGTERGGYTNSIECLMPESSVPPVVQTATARINNLAVGVTYFFAAQTYDGTNNFSTFYPTNGLRWPTLYSDAIAVEVSDDALTTWQSLGNIAVGFTNSAASYRVRAVRTEVP